MASLASYTTLYVTAIRVEGAAELKNITAVRWEAGDRRPEESSVTDFVRWLDRGDARAFVRRADGGRGPRIRVDHNGSQRYLRSRCDDAVPSEDEYPDALLLLPRWQAGKAARKHLSHHL
jgi:hypothetical protein